MPRFESLSEEMTRRIESDRQHGTSPKVFCPNTSVIRRAALRGARGNSGVILSQLLRGFTRSVKNSKELDAIDIAAAMEKGVETAYKAVMKPKEGTILTVAREAAAKAVELAETAEDLDTFFQSVIAHAEETLAKTPEMLPVLKEAGVLPRQRQQ